MSKYYKNILSLAGALLVLSACSTTPTSPSDSKYPQQKPRYEYGSPEDRRLPDSAPDANDRSFSNKPAREPQPRVESKSKLGNPPYYEVDGVVYHVLDSADGFVDVGIGSWYGKKFHGRRTSSGEVYDMYQFTAAHKTLPLPSYARVTNIDTGDSVVVKVNDRGPFKEGRIIDLSYAAAKKLGYQNRGTARVEVQVLASPRGDGTGVAYQRGELEIPPMQEQTGGNRLYVQVGAFSDEMRADTLALRLGDFFQESIKVSPVKVNGETLHRVRLGPLRNPEDAQRILQQLNQYNFGNPKVVTD